MRKGSLGYAIFDTHGGDSTLNDRSGQLVEVLYKLKDGADCDECEVGRMYHVMFADGYTCDAFDDELVAPYRYSR